MITAKPSGRPKMPLEIGWISNHAEAIEPPKKGWVITA